MSCFCFFFRGERQFAKTEFHRISGNVLGTFRNSSPLSIFFVYFSQVFGVVNFAENAESRW